MYSGLDRGAVAAGLKQGKFDATNFGEKVVSEATSTGNIMVPNAEGGVVLRPAPGEVVASVAPGETIVPRGGGMQSGGNGNVNITLNVNGIGGQDLARHLQNKINEGIYEYKRREKFH
jgi:hypothetical protein